MSDIISASPMFGAFVIASLILAVTPGPGVLYIVTRSVAQGRLSGLASVAGVALGNLGNALGAAVGLAAFLPQFIDQPHAPLVQTVTLGGVFVMIAAVTDSVYAVAGGALRPWLRRAGRFAAWGRYLTGGTFIGLGVLTALSGQRAPR